MSNSIEQDFIIAWDGISDEEVAAHYERVDLEELFKQVYGFYPSSSQFKNKASIVKQLRNRMNTLRRAAAFQHAGKSMQATPVHRMDLEALSVVEHTYSITYHKRNGEVITQTMRSHTMGSLVKKLENAGASVWKVERVD